MLGLFVCHYVTVYNASRMKPPLSSLLSDTDFIILLKSDKSRSRVSIYI
jgi:hypothetical protein